MARINVEEAINFYGGVNKLINDIEKHYSIKIAKGTIYVWKHRKSIPDSIITSMVLLDPEFDPREYGWSL